MNNNGKHMKYKGGAYAGNKYGNALSIRWKKSLEKTHTKIFRSHSLNMPVLIFLKKVLSGMEKQKKIR